jgi:hypothetical protein
MTQRTKQLVNALIGLERRCNVGEQYPVDDPFEWDCHSPELRFRWAALAALEEADASTAGVLAQLAQAAAIENVGVVLLLAREED